jgi:hypothetical protein
MGIHESAPNSREKFLHHRAAENTCYQARSFSTRVPSAVANSIARLAAAA